MIKDQVWIWGVERGPLETVLLVEPLLEPLYDSQIRPMSDWGSSGRRFRHCQPDNCDVSGHR
jgi:hypothetical protein